MSIFDQDYRRRRNFKRKLVETEVALGWASHRVYWQMLDHTRPLQTCAKEMAETLPEGHALRDVVTKTADDANEKLRAGMKLVQQAHNTLSTLRRFMGLELPPPRDRKKKSNRKKGR